MPLTEKDIKELAEGFAPEIKAEIARAIAQGPQPDLDALAHKVANILDPVLRKYIRDEVQRSVSGELNQRVDALETEMGAVFKVRSYD
jgi:hypothetical protein